MVTTNLTRTNIINIQEAGEAEYFDFHVPEYENYWMSGIFHHNTGKTTLAKYVNHYYGLPQLPSAARAVLASMDLTPDDFPQLVSNKANFSEFQLRVSALQMKMEDDVGASFVADRSFEHVVYAAHYGSVASKMVSSQAVATYMSRLTNRPDTYRMFFVRPTKACHQRAWDDNDRRFFLDWDRMNQFDGAVKFLLEAFSIKYTEITTSDYSCRLDAIDGILGLAGLRKVDR